MVGFIFEKRSPITSPPSRGKKEKTPSKRTLPLRSHAADKERDNGYFSSRKPASRLDHSMIVPSVSHSLITTPERISSTRRGNSLCATIDSSSSNCVVHTLKKDTRPQFDKDCDSVYHLSPTATLSLLNVKSRPKSVRRVLSAKKRTSIWVAKTVNLHRQRNVLDGRFSKPLLKFSSNNELLWEDVGRLRNFPRPKTPRPEDLGGSRYREHTLWKSISSQLDTLYREGDGVIDIAKRSCSIRPLKPNNSEREEEKSAPSHRPKTKLVRIPAHNVSNARKYGSNVNGTVITCGRQSRASTYRRLNSSSSSNRPTTYYILPSGATYREE